MDHTRHAFSALPDPDYEADLYKDVPFKRLAAWGVDVILISVIVGIIVMMSLLFALWFLPVVYAFTSFAYRWLTLASSSATPGMWLMAIELRTRDGDRFDSTTALLHTAGYFISVVTFPLQLISVIMMITTARGQGLTDIVMGTAAINRGVR